MEPDLSSPDEQPRREDNHGSDSASRSEDGNRSGLRLPDLVAARSSFVL
jgi:hypothetical protein